jgi:hypothetical protein
VMNGEPGALFFGWTWLAGVGVIIFLGVLLLPWFFFLLNLQNLLEQVSPPNRRMTPGLVWLNFIPVFNLGWFIYTVVKVRDSVAAEFESRSWLIDGDLGYNVGLTSGILLVAGFFISWIPFIGWVLPLAFVVAWIIYWLKTSDLRHRLEGPPAWGRPGAYPPVYPPGYPPSVYPPPYSPGGARYPQPYQPGGRPYPPPERSREEAGGQTQTPAGDERPAGHAGEGAGPAGRPDEDGAQKADERARLCGACGSKFDPGDRFCRSCGMPLP